MLGPLEVVSRRLICAAASLGSLCAALAAAVGATLIVQVVVFVSVCGAGLCIRGALVRPYQRAVINWETLYKELGNKATVTEPVDGLGGHVRYGGVNWQARSPGKTIPIGTRVKVVGLVNDMTLSVHAISHRQNAVESL